MSTRLFQRNRALESAEVRTLRRLHAIVTLARYGNPEKARAELVELVAALNDDAVPLSLIGAAIGVSKQRAHQLAQEGRAAR